MADEKQPEETEGEGEAATATETVVSSVKRVDPADESMVSYCEDIIKADGTKAKRIRRVKLIRKQTSELSNIKQRRKWKRFGAAEGASGLERGISMISLDEFSIEDPLTVNDEEDKVISQVKNAVWHSSSREKYSSTNTGYRGGAEQFAYSSSRGNTPPKSHSRNTTPHQMNRSPNRYYGDYSPGRSRSRGQYNTSNPRNQR